MIKFIADEQVGDSREKTEITPRLYQILSSQPTKVISQFEIAVHSYHLVFPTMKLSLFTLIGASALASAHCMNNSLTRQYVR